MSHSAAPPNMIVGGRAAGIQDKADERGLVFLLLKSILSFFFVPLVLCHKNLLSAVTFCPEWLPHLPHVDAMIQAISLCARTGVFGYGRDGSSYFLFLLLSIRRPHRNHLETGTIFVYFYLQLIQKVGRYVLIYSRVWLSYVSSLTCVSGCIAYGTSWECLNSPCGQGWAIDRT
jgi:hypothetical protein